MSLLVSLSSISKEDIIVSGDRPTAGGLHLGHYVGVIKNRVALTTSTQATCFFLIADIHALTTHCVASRESQIRENCYHMVAQQLACGIDGNNAAFFVQSHIPEIASISLLFSMMISYSAVSRVPSIKDMARNANIPEAEISMGLLGYPILQAADILSCGATVVPVGQDNVAHVELCRDIVKKVNYQTGLTLQLPRVLLSETPLLVGLNGVGKMSKSKSDFCIMLDDNEEVVYKKIMSMYTDPKRVSANVPGEVEGNPLFIYHDAFNPNLEEVNEFKQLYRAGKIGDVPIKHRLAEEINSLLRSIQKKQKAIIDTKHNILCLEEGAKRVRFEANCILKKLQDVLGLGCVI